MNIHAFITFNGNCREAMIFYQKCLGGNLRFQTIGESPHSEEMPARMKKNIIQGTLQNGKILLVGTDMVSEMGLIKGNSVSLMLHCENEKIARLLYKRLSTDGNQVQPLEVNHFGIMVGGLTDRYGYHWVLQCNKK